MSERLKNAVEERAVLYGFLARVFRKEADREFLEAVKSMDYSNFDGGDEYGRRFIELGKSIAGQPDAVLLDLARDYARTFLGAGLGRGQGAYPYESFYTSPDRLLMQEARDEVMFAYGEEMLKKSDDFSEPEDHIAFEMEFMAYLCRMALEAGSEDERKGYLAKQKKFFYDHLNRWAEMFAEDVLKVSRHGFYRSAAAVTAGFIAEEREFFKAV